MKSRIAIYFMLVLIVLYPFINDSSAFYSIQGSLVTDKLHGLEEIIIVEGIYFLVIDNTGLVSKNFERNDTYVEYAIMFNATWNEDITGEGVIHNGSYLMVPFSFEYEDVYVTEITITFDSTSRVSSFVTTDAGFTQFIAELADLEQESMRPLIISISVVGSVLAVLIVFISLRTRRVTPLSRIFRRRRRHLQPVRCDSCGEENPPGTTICEFCEARIKDTGEKIRSIG
ncbi:MAG: hypothetical protein H7645_03665 [Candidatus Heimdallarchaeota archaeon]|nr:hypothetical protein [Candidatus Heimdallarchaeota archaeon]MCK4769413.1 hypothetical protein [Candidatus Heimdallarchaeota archaeon]